MPDVHAMPFAQSHPVAGGMVGIADDMGVHVSRMIGVGTDGEARRAWLANAVAAARNAASAPQRFYNRHASAARALCLMMPQPCEAGRELLRFYGVRDADHWSTVDFVRAKLLLEALASLPGEQHETFVRRLYQQGDVAEQRLLLRTLVLCPRPLQFLALAQEGCRSNVRDVFEAIACDNAYAWRHFPDMNFYQLVLKALFIGVSVGRIVGLAERRSAQLTRMVGEYAAERRAAARVVSDDVTSLLADATE
jgi:hypothetical protein